MNESERELVKKVHRAAIEAMGPIPQQRREPPTLDYRELPEGKPDDLEWNFYRRQVGQLLAEGHEGHWVLIKGEQIIGIWNTLEEARAVSLKKFLMESCLIHQVRSREPLIKMSARFWGMPRVVLPIDKNASTSE